jgi:hypothetical protein
MKTLHLVATVLSLGLGLGVALGLTSPATANRSENKGGDTAIIPGASLVIEF